MGGIAKQNGIFPKDEYLAFLKRHGGNLGDKYLWD
jgi:hypothetical protein